MQRGFESSNGSKQTETMLTFWPAFEIKCAFVVYFAVAVAAAVSLLYPSIISAYWKDFVSDFSTSSSSSLEIAWLCESGCDSFSQSMSHHRKYGEYQAVYNFPLWKHTAESNQQQQNQQYAGYIEENARERYAYMHTNAHRRSHTHTHTLNMYGAVLYRNRVRTFS